LLERFEAPEGLEVRFGSWPNCEEAAGEDPPPDPGLPECELEKLFTDKLEGRKLLREKEEADVGAEPVLRMGPTFVIPETAAAPPDDDVADPGPGGPPVPPACPSACLRGR
jgi:hypothetical protein